MIEGSLRYPLPIVLGHEAAGVVDRDQAILVGEGGGAAALIPHASSRTGLHHEISKDAEVISSIGVALALVRDVVERVIPNPRPEDLNRTRREAFEAVVKLGAAPDNVEVTIEVDQNAHRVRATAMGASEMRARQRRDEIGEPEAREIAAKAMGISPERVALAATTPRMRVFQVKSRSEAGEISGSAAARFGRSISTASFACSAATASSAQSRRRPHSTACGGYGKTSPSANGALKLRTLRAGHFALLKPGGLHGMMNATDSDIRLFMFGGYDQEPACPLT